MLPHQATREALVELHETELQARRENLMRERGEHRAKKAIAQALERGEAADTPAGVQLARRAVAPLADAIRAFLSPHKGAGRRHTATKLLAGVDPELAAYVTVRSVLGFAAKQGRVQSAAMALTEMLEGEVVADAFERDHGALYRAVVRNAQARGLPSSRQRKSVDLANRQFGLVEKPWTLKQRTHLGLGVKLVELMVQTLGIVETYAQRTARKSFSHRLRFTPEIDAWVAKYNAAAALTKPLFLPTVVPPKPWEGVRDGGYHTPVIGGRGYQLIAKPFPGQLEALEEATKAGTMAPVYKGLNGLQGTPWRINKRVLEVMQAAWEGNLAGLPIPRREPEPKPEAPQAVKDDVKGGEHRRAWRRLMRGWYERDAKDKATRFEFARALSLAKEHAEFPAIYFPHRLDFRGRCYAASTTLNPQGPDDCRALLEFSEGKPLGGRGLWWLGVHGANLFGNDKVSLEERYQWALGYRMEAFRIAQDPLVCRGWTEADKPWSFLAWCFEWANAYTTSVSHMPIALDGTCNGLQHYAAMLRDEAGGKAVNLVPSDKPSDVYGDVAKIVRDKLSDLMVTEGPDQWIYDRLFQLTIDQIRQQLNVRHRS